MSLRLSRARSARWVASTSLVLTFGATSCDAPGEARRQSDVELPAGIAARVGSDSIPVTIVKRVAEQQRIDAHAAQLRVIQDALFANAARAELGNVGIVSAIERATWARAMLELLREQAQQQGSPTDGEIAALVRQEWEQYDRPPSVKTVHAVILAQGPAELERARQVMLRLREAVAELNTADEFMAAARKVDSAGLELQVQRLPAVTPDGRIIYTDEPLIGRDKEKKGLELSYARAANAIEAVGGKSDVVQTSHGLHLILLTERLPEKRYSRAELQELLQDEVYARRAAELLEGLLERTSKTSPVEVVRAASELMSRVEVAK